MYYCSNEKSSWANINDLYDRYGEEFVDKLSIRRNWDSTISEYIADESKESKTRVQTLALCDSRDIIISKLRNRYSNIHLLDNDSFHGIKHWHIKLTIELLKQGGDCKDCKNELDKFLDENKICSEKECLKKITTFISATKAVFKCEPRGGCCD